MGQRSKCHQIEHLNAIGFIEEREQDQNRAAGLLADTCFAALGGYVARSKILGRSTLLAPFLMQYRRMLGCLDCLLEVGHPSSARNRASMFLTSVRSDRKGLLRH